jgi:hypothetical protein
MVESPRARQLDGVLGRHCLKQCRMTIEADTRTLDGSRAGRLGLLL